jgi:hypothetical protein
VHLTNSVCRALDGDVRWRGVICECSEADATDIHARYETVVKRELPRIAGDRCYGYEDDLRDKVAGTLRSSGLIWMRIELGRGLFQNTLWLEEFGRAGAHQTPTGMSRCEPASSGSSRACRVGAS